MNSVFHAALAAIVVCLTPGIDVSAEDRFFEQDPDSYIKLGDIKGEYRSDEYRSDPDSYIKLGDIKGEYKTGTPAERVNAQDWLSEWDDLIWEAEADDFFWRDGKRSPSELPDPWIWEEESGDF